MPTVTVAGYKHLLCRICMRASFIKMN